MARSYYDELHDRYQAILTTKAGTRYERLAAVVFAALEKQSIVIHDLKLIGDSGVKHQIDVTIERDGVRRRILIECKDYDISGSPVGLGVVRDFFGVVDDVKPDEAWIITCNRFTPDAQQYCKSKGIKMATLRAFREQDWLSRVKTIVANMTLSSVELESLKLEFLDETDAVRFNGDVAAEYPNGLTLEVERMEVFDGTSVRSLRDLTFESLDAETLSKSSPTETRAKKTPGGWISSSGKARYPISEYQITVKANHSKSQLELSAVEEAVLLLLSGDDGLDFVVWENLLEGFTISDDGVVRLAPDAVQKRLRQKVTFLPPNVQFPNPHGSV